MRYVVFTRLFALFTCWSVASMSFASTNARAEAHQIPAFDAVTMTDIYETVFRHQFNKNASSAQQKASAYFLRIGKNDPSLDLLKRLSDNPIPVLPGSQFREGDMRLLFHIDDVQRIDEDTANVKGGYYEGGLSASGNDYRVVRKGNKWVVEKDAMQWIAEAPPYSQVMRV